MYKLLRICGLTLLLCVGTVQASNWDEDNVPPAGSVVNADGSVGVIHRGFYFGLEGGGTMMNDEDFDILGATATLSNKLGYNGGVTIGYDYKWLRIEEELNAARNSTDKLSFEGFEVNIDGRTTSYNAMTNLILNMRQDTGLGAFVGAGIGGSLLDFKVTAGGDSDSTHKGAFTAQALAGISYAFNHSVELDLEYRYLDAMLTDNNIPDYRTNNLDLGVKFFMT